MNARMRAGMHAIKRAGMQSGIHAVTCVRMRAELFADRPARTRAGMHAGTHVDTGTLPILRSNPNVPLTRACAAICICVCSVHQ